MFENYPHMIQVLITEESKRILEGVGKISKRW